MQSVAVLLALVAVASAVTVYRVPSADSAVIESHRVGGNFAYSTSEAHAHGVVSPVVSHVATPVATTYSAAYPTYTSVSGYPYASVSGYPYTSWPAVSNVVSSYPATTYVQGTPANTVKTVPAVGYSVVV